MIEKLMKIQDELNKFTIGEDWVNMSNLNGKEINWWRCIYMESVEAIDSLDWKHWKSQKDDFENLKVEVVDILHFILSLMIKYEKYASKLSYTIGSEVKGMLDNNTSLIYNFEKLINITSDTSSDNELKLNNLILRFNVLLSALNKEEIMDKNELYSLYVGKSVLNLFRQKHGYKDGTYKKIWAGVEDNVHMQTILETESDPDKIYKILEETYKAVDTQ